MNGKIFKDNDITVELGSKKMSDKKVLAKDNVNGVSKKKNKKPKSLIAEVESKLKNIIGEDSDEFDDDSDEDDDLSGDENELEEVVESNSEEEEEDKTPIKKRKLTDEQRKEKHISRYCGYFY